MQSLVAEAFLNHQNLNPFLIITLSFHIIFFYKKKMP